MGDSNEGEPRGEMRRENDRSSSCCAVEGAILSERMSERHTGQWWGSSTSCSCLLQSFLSSPLLSSPLLSSRLFRSVPLGNSLGKQRCRSVDGRWQKEGEGGGPENKRRVRIHEQPISMPPTRQVSNTTADARRESRFRHFGCRAWTSAIVNGRG